jgi:uncharacterized membrane-anchored protein YjiN (DUF445 family)
MAGAVLLIGQFQHEIEGWKRILVFLKEENISLKNRLSEILKNVDGSYTVLMERIEYFHNHLLKQDEITRFLQSEVKNHEKCVTGKVLQNEYLLSRQIAAMQRKLGSQIENAERNFNNLKYEFNSYLAEILSE